MSTTSTRVPPLNKISLIGIWIETVLWGMNCIVFIGVLRILFWNSNRRPSRVLAATSIILFIFATIHISGSLRQLLEAFVFVPTNAPLYSTLYWLDETNKIAIMKTVVYDTTVWLQDMILIWRMYVVWGNNWKICILPIIVEIAHMGSAYAATALLAKPNSNIYGSELARLGPVGWSLDLAVNVSVTIAISSRLWYMGKKVSSLSLNGSGRTHIYMSSILTLVESGAIFAAVTLVMLVLYLVGSPLALTGIDISTQLAVLTPLLIIVRVGLGLTHQLTTAYKSFLDSTGEMAFGMSSFSEQSNRYPGRAPIQIATSVSNTTSSDAVFHAAKVSSGDLEAKNMQV